MQFKPKTQHSASVAYEKQLGVVLQQYFANKVTDQFICTVILWV